MKFTKSHGLGNDFVLIESEELSGIPPSLLPAFARGICDRHFGVGADGLLILSSSPGGHDSIRILNSDGSAAEMCGNGIRCAAHYLMEKRPCRESLLIETPAGLLECRIKEHSTERAQVAVNMGKPRWDRAQIPMKGLRECVGETLQVDDRNYEVSCVSMGNPHCVLFLDRDLPEPSVLGPMVEKHPDFPEGANVEFARVLSTSSAEMRVWERGAGETLACGTGACAVAVTGIRTGRLFSPVTVHLAGGDLLIEWSGPASPVWMTGPALLVFSGQADPSLFLKG
ncbi:MAG: diaminopimelate epimerase [Armatimonadetes bacterium]|nr:diaminopimelate epimerase [Armatimonadota bacterium]